MPSTIVSRSAVFRSEGIPTERASQYVVPDVAPEAPLVPTQVKRLAHVGGCTWDFSRPSRYCIRELEGPVPCLESNSLADYETGCRQHRNCYGHLCNTPAGVRLVPGILAKRTTENRNLFNEAARVVFERPRADVAVRYQDFLRSIMLGKRGHLRGSMVSCHIEGSARLVIAPSWSVSYQEVSIPISLARNFRSATAATRDGEALLRYGETNIQDGDWVILVRPPSLGHANVQPLKVRLWDKPCIGLYPGHCAEYHADFDGDEMQFYHVSSKSSVLECEQWCPVSEDPFASARALHSKLRANSSEITEDSSSGGTFVEASNMSVQEILEGHPSPLLSSESRMKPDMVMEFAQRLRTEPKDNQDIGFRYVAASIAGQCDIRRQQLSQGHIGDVGRQARLAATCFSVDEMGAVLVCKGAAEVCIGKEPMLVSTRGNVFLRGVNVLCAKAQQVLLDSHRAGVAEATGRNLVEDLVQGSDVTLLSVRTEEADLVRNSGCMEWGVNTETEYVALVRSEHLTEDIALKCLALSTPTGLSIYAGARIEQGVTAELVSQECMTLSERAVHIVCVQTGVSVSREESRALAWMFSYEPAVHKHPVTQKYGGAARGLRPFVTLLNVHFGMFPALCSDGSLDSYSNITTMSEHLAFGGQFC